MPSKKRIEWNGVSYPSIKEAATALGVSERAMSQRVKRGYDGIIACVWNGVEYNSVAEAAKATGISKSTLYRKLRGDNGDSSQNN
jgi:predicted DNA-binding protein (UPF0251 family)